MTHSTIKNATPPLSKNKDAAIAWYAIVWREWRNCADKAYAIELYHLVARETSGQSAILISSCLWGFLGMFGGILLMQLRHPTLWNGGLLALYSGLGFIIAAFCGGVLLSALIITRRLRWLAWVQTILPNKPFHTHFREGNLYFNLFAVVFAGSTSGLIVGMISAIFFGIGVMIVGASNIFLLIAMMFFILILIFRALTPVVDLVVVLPGVLAFALVFNLGFIFWALYLGFDINNLISIVTLPLGLGVGFYVGRWTGLSGTLMSLFILLPFSFIPIIGNWLMGLFLGVVCGNLSLLVKSQHNSFDKIYAYRRLCFWWRNRPLSTTLEMTLRMHGHGTKWSQLFEQLDQERQQLVAAKTLWSYLRQPAWSKKFVGRHALVTLGGAAVSHLLTIHHDSNHPQQDVATWLLRSISEESSSRLSAQAQELRCIDCLTSCAPHKIKLSVLPISYYGCRVCGQSRNFFHCPQGVVAVLDQTMSDKYHHQASLLQVNWLIQRQLFDFNRVQINTARDEDVERFAVQIGNDTDLTRQDTYEDMVCQIEATNSLSENTLCILRQTFAVVS